MAAPSRPEASLQETAPRLGRAWLRQEGWPAALWLAFLTFLGAEGSHRLWLRGGEFPMLWAPLGLHLAALLLSRRRYWPLLTLASGVAWLGSAWALHGRPFPGALALFGVQTATAFGGALFLAGWRGHRFRLESLPSVWLFAGTSVLVSGAVAGPLGAWWACAHYPLRFSLAWAHWSVASLAALWLCTPPALACEALRLLRTRRRTLGPTLEGLLLFSTLLLASMAMFGAANSLVALPSLLLMWVIWAVMRFGAVGGGSAMLLIAVIASLATGNGIGPFARGDLSRSEIVVRLLVYLVIWAGFSQVLAAILAERSRAEAELAALNRSLEERVQERTEELTRAGAELRLSENRLALAVKAGRTGTYDLDLERNINVWSDDLLELYGLRRDEFTGTFEAWLQALHPEDRLAGEKAVQEALRTGQFAFIFRIVRRDSGEIRWMDGRGKTFFNEDGRAVRLLGLNVDITEQRRVEEALATSERRFQYVLQAVHLGVWSVNLETGALEASAECRHILGLHAHEKLPSYEAVRARIHREDREAEAAAALAAKTGGGEYQAEYRVRWPDGSYHWILARGQLSPARAGEAPLLSGIALDITERKRAEGALAESESRLRSYYEAAPLFMGLLELDGNDLLHLYDNPASCRFLGVPLGGTIGHHTSEFVRSAETLENWLRHYRLAAEKQQPIRFEMAHTTSGSGERWLSATITPLASGSSGRPRFSYVAEDVTQRRRVENSLRQHASRQATLLELTRTILARRADAPALASAIFQRVATVLDTDLGFNYRLHPGEGLELVASFGVLPEHAGAGKLVSLHDNFCGLVALSGQPLIADQARINQDSRAEFIRGLGARAYACHPLLNSEGRVLGTLSFCSTHRERFEPEEVSFLQTLCHYVAIAWERSAAELAMQQARDTAEAASRAKDEFLAALSHELRTPLNPVLLLASDLQQQESVPLEIRQDLATIQRNVELEARLIDDLLDLTRITRGKVHLDNRVVSVHRVLHETIAILQGDLSTRSIHLHWQLEEGEPLVWGDPVRLQQVLWNVLRNAIKFTPPEGGVTVRTFCTSGAKRVVIEIADTGEGIDPEHLQSIFETFNQGAGGHRFGGLGLGLAIARSIIVLHGGSISAQSSGPGGGATFRIELPSHLPSRETGEPHRQTPLSEAPERLGSLRILLVEDHEPTREALARLLQRRGHHVTAAESVAAGRALFAAERFDLLISDLGLPDGDGTELMQAYREQGGRPGLALSGYGMEGDVQRSMEAGFFAHLVKPVDVRLLDRTLAEWADREPRPPEPASHPGSPAEAMPVPPEEILSL